ncbi:MAG: HNH endonuclease, partial [Deltaproteobacteria bacterium]
SLAIHGLICAHCGREFDFRNRHLLTVHHRDNNHKNNPPDGSNWENLCVYCHEATHSRSLLGEYLSQEVKSSRENAQSVYRDNEQNMGSVMGDKIKILLKKNKK